MGILAVHAVGKGALNKNKKTVFKFWNPGPSRNCRLAVSLTAARRRYSGDPPKGIETGLKRFFIPRPQTLNPNHSKLCPKACKPYTYNPKPGFYQKSIGWCFRCFLGFLISGMADLGSESFIYLSHHRQPKEKHHVPLHPDHREDLI